MDKELELAIENVTDVNTAIVVRQSDTSSEFLSLSSVCLKYCLFYTFIFHFVVTNYSE
jgi:hypothetical protein